jgi:Skp family chaperone for outer membrane proteins
VTIDERIEKLEHVTAAHIEQARKDYEENRRLWREQQADIGAIWKASERRSEEVDRRFREVAEGQRETDRMLRQYAAESREREQRLDQRIGDLVSAIGELVRRLGKGNDSGTA